MQDKNCSNCIKGMPVTVNEDILCRVKGIVSADYVCSKHSYIPETRELRHLMYKCVDCANFIYDANNASNPSSLGLCRLFSVRQFDGTQKNSCSKFVKRTA